MGDSHEQYSLVGKRKGDLKSRIVSQEILVVCSREEQEKISRKEVENF